MPGWLDGKTGSPMIVNKAQAKVVQRIFEMAASGLGKRLIARRLNQEKVPTFGKASCGANLTFRRFFLTVPR